MKKIILLVILLLVVTVYGIKMGYLSFGKIKQYVPSPLSRASATKVVVESEESVITKVVESTLPSVVTVSISTTQTSPDIIQMNPFDPFTPFNTQPGKTQKIEQNIGSGFIVSSDGLIVTNKHVVADTSATYKVITTDNKTYPAVQIFRDPLNDLGFL